MTKKIWKEKLYENIGQYFTIKNIVCRINTGKQDLIIFENEIFGKIMALDKIIQTTEYDEFIYHEMITHVPLFAHGKAKKILVFGGGDGGVIREISKHKYVEQITLVEIDSNVIELCKKYLPNHSSGSFNDIRLKLIIMDGLKFIIKNKEMFDIIISDCTDPIGPSKNLFTSIFYQYCAKCLNKGGIFVSQNGVCFLQKKEIINSYKKLSLYFNDVSFYQATIPTYYGGNMIFAWASQDKKIRKTNTLTLLKRIEYTKLTNNYYNVEIHKNSFALPQYLLNTLSTSC